MNSIRENSLSPLSLDGWTWNPFFEDMINQISIFEFEEYPIPDKFLYNKVLSKSLNDLGEIKISTWACKFNKIKQARAACLHGGKSFSVFNLVIHPFSNYNLPFFGADLVTLPNGYLLALDLQPALKNDSFHTQDVWELLKPLHHKWQSMLPFGGEIPKEAKPFFSPGFLWTRLPLDKSTDLIIDEVIRPAFKDYLSLYIKLLKNAERVSDDISLKILDGQISYLNYRSTKDPARAMLSRFYGKEWTEEYIHKVLFNPY
ncbi:MULTISPECIES: phycoerythrobilin:ferredoxin oxidoreductase [unclassified Prochlorococcus]|uniref:phycoerythrobilin:ferredoxin oxidoreductase n=1 Tax=unclassified Prochlorococcus TaxID=2627481 RepID=UPI0005337B4F|nr:MULTISPECIES: phycoerythrobilin:ferredoxin oxidoreductase [unclassified Prochlorococcus]KGG14639.1 Phycoerythrobilin:ferredoxin oxidoreductase PebB [Prochlorococcus sp. MIT 0602]KGG15932.1 Phycoerythrobilin:ferredoxin oxidoreductase PebB [Prochlorococcus sp. MIT 0603]